MFINSAHSSTIRLPSLPSLFLLFNPSFYSTIPPPSLPSLLLLYHPPFPLPSLLLLYYPYFSTITLNPVLSILLCYTFFITPSRLPSLFILYHSFFSSAIPSLIYYTSFSTPIPPSPLLSPHLLHHLPPSFNTLTPYLRISCNLYLLYLLCFLFCLLFLLSVSSPASHPPVLFPVSSYLSSSTLFLPGE